MSNQHGPGWTLDTLKILMDERDRRYDEMDRANKLSLSVALATATKADEKTEQALKEYKTGANEWRDTVKDLIAMREGGSKGMRDMWGWVIAAALVGVELYRIFAPIT